MPIRKDHTGVVYRRENGMDVVYSTSLISPAFLPLFVKFTYTFPNMLVLFNEDVEGTISASRLLFPSSAENLVHRETSSHLVKVVAGYFLPFTDRVFSIPSLLRMGIFSTQVRFYTTPKGTKRMIPIANEEDFTPLYMRFSMNKGLTSYVSKYYNQKWLYPLFTGVLSEKLFTDYTEPMLK